MANVLMEKLAKSNISWNCLMWITKSKSGPSWRKYQQKGSVTKDESIAHVVLAT